MIGKHEKIKDWRVAGAHRPLRSLYAFAPSSFPLNVNMSM